METIFCGTAHPYCTSTPTREVGFCDGKLRVWTLEQKCLLIFCTFVQIRPGSFIAVHRSDTICRNLSRARVTKCCSWHSSVYRYLEHLYCRINILFITTCKLLSADVDKYWYQKKSAFCVHRINLYYEEISDSALPWNASWFYKCIGSKWKQSKCFIKTRSGSAVGHLSAPCWPKLVVWLLIWSRRR